MRLDFGFDPENREYGVATASVRTILHTWMDVDWFAPTSAHDDDGITLFREYNRIAHARDRDRFSPHVGLGIDAGDFAAFDAWCVRVRDYTDSRNPDWKFNVLKPLSRAHRDEHEFELDRDGLAFARRSPRPGDLFFDAGQSGVFWNVQLPPLDVGEHARFYASYAHGDMLDAILWQLAEKTNELGGNPFWQLVRCYRAGFYPFYLNRDKVVLFRFC